MLSRELDPLIGYRLSYTVRENLKTYYDAFKVCNNPRNRGDLTPFVISFLEIVKESMQQLDEALTKRFAELSRYENLLLSDKYGKEERYKDLLYILLQASLFSEEGIRTQDLLDLLNISRTTLGVKLREISPSGYIEVVTNGGVQKFYKLNLKKLQ